MVEHILVSMHFTSRKNRRVFCKTTFMYMQDHCPSVNRTCILVSRGNRRSRYVGAFSGVWFKLQLIFLFYFTIILVHWYRCFLGYFLNIISIQVRAARLLRKMHGRKYDNYKSFRHTFVCIYSEPSYF